MRAYLSAIAAAVVCVGFPAHAATFVPARNMSFDLDPIAPAGYFSSWSVIDLRGLDALHTRAAFGWFGRDPKWSPGFKIMLRSGKELVAFSVGGRPAEPMRAQLEHYSGQTLISVDDFDLTADSNDEIVIDLYWSAEGLVTASVARQGGKDSAPLSAKLPKGPEELSVSVSTANVHLVPLELGNRVP